MRRDKLFHSTVFSYLSNFYINTIILAIARSCSEHCIHVRSVTESISEQKTPSGWYINVRGLKHSTGFRPTLTMHYFCNSAIVVQNKSR